MKKLIYGGLFLAIVGMVFAGCKKEEITLDRMDISKPFVTSNMANEKAVLQDEGATKKFREIPEIPGATGCWEDPRPNCFDPVNITEEAIAVISNIQSRSENGNREGVIELIKLNYALLSHYIPANDLNLIISGNLTVRVKDMRNIQSKFYFILSEESENFHVFQLSVGDQD